MRAQLTNRDYEQLSAYIDGQLSPVERNKLEERLSAHSELQAALDEMSRTRALLRSAPRRRAPRNFTLTPAMVGEQRQRRSGSWWNLFPVLSFTSAVATLALVATIVFQLLPAQMRAQTSAEPQVDQVANIVQQTMTAMALQDSPPAAKQLPAPQATAPAEQAPLPAAGAPALETGAALDPSLAPTLTPGMERQAASTAVPTLTQTAVSTEAAAMAVPLMEATPTLPPEQPSAEAQMVPEQATEPDAAQADPPVVAWGNSDPAVPPGMGGMGGGGGQGGTGGSLLGPPEAAQNSLEMGKGGAGGNGYSVPGQNIVIPQASVNAEDSAADVQSDAAPAQANPQISGPGPILGVPAAEESGQIVDRKAILGQPSAKASEPGQQTGQESERAGEDGSQPARPPMILGLPVILALQILLALIAIATGAAAFLMRRRAR